LEAEERGPGVLSLSAPDYPTTRLREATRLAGSLIPREIAAPYTISATPTTEPTTGPEKRAFSGVGDQRSNRAIQAIVRY